MTLGVLRVTGSRSKLHIVRVSATIYDSTSSSNTSILVPLKYKILNLAVSCSLSDLQV